MIALLHSEIEASELSEHLGEYLYASGVYGWTVSVTKNGEAATRGPDGSPEPTEGSNESPGNDDTFYVRKIPDGG